MIHIKLLGNWMKAYSAHDLGRYVRQVSASNIREPMSYAIRNGNRIRMVSAYNGRVFAYPASPVDSCVIAVELNDGKWGVLDGDTYPALSFLPRNARYYRAEAKRQKKAIRKRHYRKGATLDTL